MYSNADTLPAPTKGDPSRAWTYVTGNEALRTEATCPEREKTGDLEKQLEEADAARLPVEKRVASLQECLKEVERE